MPHDGVTFRSIFRVLLLVVAFVNLLGVSTASAQDARGVLLYDNVAGVGITGQLDVQGNLTTLQEYDGLPTGWTHTVPSAYNVTFLYNQDTRTAATAYLDPDGTFTTLQAFGNFPQFWTQVVSVGGGRLLFYTQRGVELNAATGRIDTLGNYSSLVLDLFGGTSTGWTHIVKAFNDVLFFYNANNRMAATGWINPQGGFVNLRTLSGFGLWTHVVPANFDTLLFYNHDTGEAAVGRVSLDGNFVNLQNYTNFSLGWTHVKTGTNGTLLFYNADRGNAATGRVYSDHGDFATLQSYDSIGQGWTQIAVQ